MPRLTTPGIHHVALTARDAGRTRAFYRDVLGLREVERPGREGHWLGDERGRPGTLVNVREGVGVGRGGWGVGGIHHVAFGVADESALLLWKRWLADQGVASSGPYDRGWFRSLYFADPDGQVLELATAGPGYARDEPMDALGQRLILPAEAQLRGHRDEAAIQARMPAEPVTEITPAMRLSGIHHITGMTDDIERAHGFYTEVLGLRLVKRSVNQDDPGTPHLFWANYDGTRVAPHSTLTLFGWPDPRARRARAGVGQTRHVAFRAADAAELFAWEAHFRAQGVEVTAAPAGVGGGLYFRSPDGLLLQMVAD